MTSCSTAQLKCNHHEIKPSLAYSNSYCHCQTPTLCIANSKPSKAIVDLMLASREYSRVALAP